MSLIFIGLSVIERGSSAKKANFNGTFFCIPIMFLQVSCNNNEKSYQSVLG